LVATMACMSFAVATLQGAQARLEREHRGMVSRARVSMLCYLQPLIRSWSRDRTRFLSSQAPRIEPSPLCKRRKELSLLGRRYILYWSEAAHERTELLGLTVVFLQEHGWGKTIDSGWEDWDLEIHGNAWTALQVCTAQEDHGQGKRLIRVRYRLR